MWKERGKALADAVDGEALPLEELNSFKPVMTGMVLANTTSVGMHPNVEDTPISKVKDSVETHIMFLFVHMKIISSAKGFLV